MKAEIFSAPEKIELPKVDFANYDHNEAIKNEEKYLQAVRDELISHYGKDSVKEQLTGEIVRFQIADGYAVYMVMTMNPCNLVHIELGDGYRFHEELLTAEYVYKTIEQEKAMAKLFS